MENELKEKYYYIHLKDGCIAICSGHTIEKAWEKIQVKISVGCLEFSHHALREIESFEIKITK